MNGVVEVKGISPEEMRAGYGAIRFQIGEDVSLLIIDDHQGFGNDRIRVALMRVKDQVVSVETLGLMFPRAEFITWLGTLTNRDGGKLVP